MKLCPDDETFAAWFDGVLARDVEETFLTHVAGCLTCSDTLGDLAELVRLDMPEAWARAELAPAHVIQRALDLWPADTGETLADVVRIAVRWIGRTLAPLADALQPTPALAVRSAAEAEELRYHVTVGDVALEVDLEPDEPGQVAVHLRPLRPPPPGLLLRLRSAGETRALSTLGAAGASLPALEPGEYELTLERADHPLGQLHLSLLPPAA